jgi:cytochrome c biogenesis protein CcdA
MTIGTLGLAFLAGGLSILSPCVLPLVPIVLGAAAIQHRLGSITLAAGLGLSFTAIGLFVATIGFAIGLDQDVLRTFGGVLLIAVGFILTLPNLQAQVATAAGPVSNWVEQRFGEVDAGGLGGQFSLGLLLGAVWSPCVGPRLGAASVLAAQGRDLIQVALTMLVFGIGAAAPLILLGLVSREAMMRWRGKLVEAGTAGKMLLGTLLILLGIFIVTGLDKRGEALLVDLSPTWLTSLTTQF